QVVAEHRRSWDKEGIFFDPRHYLALLERKPGALNYALPLEDLKLDPCFDTLYRRLEAEQHKQGHGTREFIKVLRLLENHSQPKLTRAVKKALRIGAHSRDAVAQFLIPRASWFPLIFMMDGCEHLRSVKVEKPDVAAYGALVKEVPCE
ncbi:MAG: IS21 family transposase, partial [Desulfobulbia bacterium]